jgi:hypothetical protein
LGVVPVGSPLAQNPTKTAYSAPEPEAQQGAREFFNTLLPSRHSGE